MTTSTIAALNDAFRKGEHQGTNRLLVTAGVSAKPASFVLRCLAQVRDFEAFSPDNDPYGEHDFGSFEVQGEKLF